jgi:hypothetical protein
VHINPVKHGLVGCVRDWPYSTFQRYVELGLYPENWAEGPGIFNLCAGSMSKHLGDVAEGATHFRPTLLTALDLADRIAKRRRAKTLIETAERIRIERCVEVLTITAEGARPLADLNPDALLDLVEGY